MSDSLRSTLAWAAAMRAPGLGATSVLKALQHFGEMASLQSASAATLQSLGMGQEAIDWMHGESAHSQAESDVQWMQSAGATLLPITSSLFPPQLRALRDAPFALYVLGSVDALSLPQVAIVGSRVPTAAGRRIAMQIANGLSSAGLMITSGLARGIDTAAHEAALAAGGRTLAVLGTGPDLCYPADNRPLLHRILERGAVVSEFPPGTPPVRHNFPRRNRIISGLARGTVVVEAAADSGSLITARKALEQGREVFAVPGSPLNPQAAGCLDLLLEGAHLTRDARDVLEQIEIPIEGNPSSYQCVTDDPKPAGGAARLDKDYEMLLDALGFEPASIDDLVDRTGFNPGTVASMMLILELEGRVETRPGALFNRVT